MKLNRAILPANKPETFDEEIDFSSLKPDENHVKRIDKCLVKVIATEFGDVLQCAISGNADVIASCSYTLEDVPLHVEFKETLYFSSEVMGSQECYYELGVEIDLNPHILALILAEVPHNITKSGASLPKSGNGYRVLSEDDFEKERKNKGNNAFDALDAIEFDDEN